MLFNKDDNGAEELKEHLGFLWSSTRFSNMASEIELAKNDVSKIFGTDVIDAAIDHYESNDYGSSSKAKLNRLVKLVQKPIALFAYLSYAPDNDLSHNSEGRQIKVTEDTKPAFEWQIRRSERNIMRKAHKSLDLAFDYLEKEKDEFDFWKNSDTRKAMLSLWLRSADEFDKFFPIDSSRYLYVLLVPFINDVQQNDIRPMVGTTRFDGISTKLKDGNNLSDQEKEIKRLGAKAIAIRVMALAVRRLNAQLLPEGLLHQYVMSSQRTKSGEDFTSSWGRVELSALLTEDAREAEAKLQSYIHRVKKEENPDTQPRRSFTEHLTKDKKGARL